MQCSCQPKFHARDDKVLTYLFVQGMLGTFWTVGYQRVVFRSVLRLKVLNAL